MKSAVEKLLSSIPYFQDLDPVVVRQIIQAAVQRDYETGQFVLFEGEPSAGLFIIERGWVKAIKISPDGREQVLNIVGAGEAINMISVFTGAVNPASVVALEPTTLWVIFQDAMERLLDTQPQLVRRIIHVMAGRILHLVGLVEDLSLRSVEARLARLLVDESKNGVIQRKRWATQAEIAARLGTVPDVLNRAFRKLVEEEVIQLERQQISIIDLEELEKKGMIL
jgi:CRP/FNR family transcriptional regulator